MEYCYHVAYYVIRSAAVAVGLRSIPVSEPISRPSQCSTTGVTKAVVCVILSVGVMHIK